MVRRFGIMKTIVAGALSSSVGMLSSSFATNIYILYLTYGLLSGMFTKISVLFIFNLVGSCLCYSRYVQLVDALYAIGR